MASVGVAALHLQDARDELHVGVGEREPGIELETPIAAIYSIERGLIVREQQFASWEAGLRAAGLRE